MSLHPIHRTKRVKNEVVLTSTSRFVKDGADFSINTDDPMVTGRTLTDEYELVRDMMGLTWAQMVKAVSSFVRDDNFPCNF